MTATDDFIDECQAEWHDLGVPRNLANGLLDELVTDPDLLAGEGALPDEIGGHPTSDPHAFAEARARERGYLRRRGQATRARPSRRLGIGALIVLFTLGAIAGVIEFRHPSDDNQELGTDTTIGIRTSVDLVSVPDLRGLTEQTATRTAQRVGIRVGDVANVSTPGTAPGIVVRVIPPGGTRIGRGTTISLVVAR
jgi:hypothetical protein